MHTRRTYTAKPKHVRPCQKLIVVVVDARTCVASSLDRYDPQSAAGRTDDQSLLAVDHHMRAYDRGGRRAARRDQEMKRRRARVRSRHDSAGRGPLPAPAPAAGLGGKRGAGPRLAPLKLPIPCAPAGAGDDDDDTTGIAPWIDRSPETYVRARDHHLILCCWIN